jgi:hypothetical protein
MLKRSLSLLLLVSAPAFADQPVIKSVSVDRDGPHYSFNVMIEHTDTGWEDYADKWRVLSLDGSVLGERNLAHPHVNEQPFTRALSGVKIPAGTTTVKIQVSDTVNGWSSNFKQIDLK